MHGSVKRRGGREATGRIHTGRMDPDDDFDERQLNDAELPMPDDGDWDSSDDENDDERDSIDGESSNDAASSAAKRAADLDWVKGVSIVHDDPLQKDVFRGAYLFYTNRFREADAFFEATRDEPVYSVGRAFLSVAPGPPCGLLHSRASQSAQEPQPAMPHAVWPMRRYPLRGAR